MQCFKINKFMQFLHAGPSAVVYVENVIEFGETHVQIFVILQNFAQFDTCHGTRVHFFAKKKIPYCIQTLQLIHFSLLHSYWHPGVNMPSSLEAILYLPSLPAEYMAAERPLTLP